MPRCRTSFGLCLKAKWVGGVEGGPGPHLKFMWDVVPARGRHLDKTIWNPD